MASSSVPSLKHQLVLNLQARPGLANVQVTHGPPLPVPEAEFIWLGDAQGTQTRESAGNTKLETYNLQVIVRVLSSTTADDFKTAGDRAFALMAELENELRGDKTVSGAVRDAEVTDFDFKEGANAETNEALLDVTVHVQALI